MIEKNVRHSRRQFFLAGSAAAATLVLRPRCLKAEQRDRPPLSFIVVSDTHLGYRDQEQAEMQWLQTAEELRAADGAFVLHLGDVVDGGREAQYPKYLAIRGAIGKPVYEIPGNHDPQELFAKYVRTPVDAVVEHQWLRVVLLNNAHTDSHDGFLTEAQLDWIEQQSQQAREKDQLALLCMHVPAHANRHPDRGWHVKPEHGQTKLYGIVGRHQERILALFHGHFHNGIRGWDDRSPVHEVVFPSALYNLDRKLESQGAAGYNPLEFRPGYVLVEIAGGAIRLKYKPLGAKTSVERTCPVA